MYILLQILLNKIIIICIFYSFQNTCELFKIVQDAVQSAKLAVQGLESELKRLVQSNRYFIECFNVSVVTIKGTASKICLQIHEESSFSSVSAKSVAALTDLLGKCRERLDTCCHELSKLKNAVNSKEKLVSYIYIYLFIYYYYYLAYLCRFIVNT